MYRAMGKEIYAFRFRLPLPTNRIRLHEWGLRFRNLHDEVHDVAFLEIGSHDIKIAVQMLVGSGYHSVLLPANRNLFVDNCVTVSLAHSAGLMISVVCLQIVSCGKALMDEFVPLHETMAADKVEQRGEGNILRKDVPGVVDGRLTDPNSTATRVDNFSTMVFVLLFNVQLEAFQIALADHRHGENSEDMGKQTASSHHKSSASGRGSLNESDAYTRSGNKEGHEAGSGRSCYIATLPILVDLSVGSGYESRLSAEINGAQLGIVAKKVKTKGQERNEQQQVVEQNLLQGSKLEFDKLIQIATTGFALDRCAVQLRLPIDDTSLPNNQVVIAEGQAKQVRRKSLLNLNLNLKLQKPSAFLE